jgi:hypothetical protein
VSLYWHGGALLAILENSPLHTICTETAPCNKYGPSGPLNGTPCVIVASSWLEGVFKIPLLALMKPLVNLMSLSFDTDLCTGTSVQLNDE